MVWVAAAGPSANLVQAFFWALLGVSLLGFGIDEPFFLTMAKAGVLVNLVMFALNLFPVPPLDGGRILVGVLPRPLAYAVARIEPFGFFIVMGLVIAGLLATWWMLPLMRATLNLMRAVFPSLNAVLSAQV